MSKPTHVKFLDSLCHKLAGYELLKSNHGFKNKMAFDNKTDRKQYINRFFIVLQNKLVKKLSGRSLSEEVLLLQGSIVESESFLGNGDTKIRILENNDVLEDDYWKCPLSILSNISDKIYPFIIAVPSPTDRIKLAKDPQLCFKLADLQEDDLVEFFIPDSQLTHLARIKEIGQIDRISPGIHFRIEFLDQFNDSDRDDFSNNDQCLSCSQDSNPIVTIDQIRPWAVSSKKSCSPGKKVSSSFHAVKNKFENMSTVSNSSLPSYISAKRNGSCVNFKPGDNVIWRTDSGKTFDGSVRYVIHEGSSISKLQLHLKNPSDEYPAIASQPVPVSQVFRKEDFLCSADKNGIDSIDGDESHISNSKICSFEQNGRGLKHDVGYSHGNRGVSGYPDYSKFELDDPNNFCDDINMSIIHSRQARINSLETSNKHSTMAFNDNIPIAVLELLQEIDSRKTLRSVKHLKKCQPRSCQPVMLDDNFSDDSESYDGYDNVANLSDFDPVLSEFSVGSVVAVDIKNKKYHGVIRWIGSLHVNKKCTFAGIEMEYEDPMWSDGTYDGVQYFACPPKRACFIPLRKCQKDTRFLDDALRPSSMSEIRSKDFGQPDCPIIPGIVKPISKETNIESLCGKYKGIQGHHNSCYLDATLFAMFTFTSVFDTLLFRPRIPSDIEDYEEVQRVLREEIVNPLRENMYVRADRVMKLRTLLEKLSSVSGLTSEEKDPEEFLNSLLAQILRAEPFLKLSSGQEAYYYQLFVEKDEQLKLPTVQQLFEQSFLTSDIKLKEVPSCLIIQMPRFGKSYKMYPRILPSQLLDVTDVIEDSPRQCSVCGKLARYECNLCFRQCEEGLQCTAFCKHCCETAHSHEKRIDHRVRKLNLPPDCEEYLSDHYTIPRLYMELFAVVCIETSHYVAFVKAGCGNDAPWCFFDSMADRQGEQNGYNIPEMVSCPNLPYWLSEKGSESLNHIKDERQLPEHAKRLLCDAYMCMYQSREVMMYR